jgi:hypothetical protein
VTTSFREIFQPAVHVQLSSGSKFRSPKLSALAAYHGRRGCAQSEKTLGAFEINSNHVPARVARNLQMLLRSGEAMTCQGNKSGRTARCSVTKD